MEIVDDKTHRVLAYVGALNQHGVRPNADLVDEYADRPKRRSTRVGGIGGLSSLARLEKAVYGRPTFKETESEYIERLGWALNTSSGVSLTSAGRALLKALNASVLESDTVDIVEVVLDADDPFAYATAIGALANAGESLLVDPYFRVSQLVDIQEVDNITRILVGSGMKNGDYQALAVGLKAVSQGPLEIRKASGLHDRYLIPDGPGNALMIGTSLGGVGRKVSTLTSLGEPATDALRQLHESIWADAEVIGARAAEADVVEPPAAEPLDDGDDSASGS